MAFPSKTSEMSDRCFIGWTSVVSLVDQVIDVSGCIGEAGSPVPRPIGEAQVIETTADTITDNSELIR